MKFTKLFGSFLLACPSFALAAYNCSVSSSSYGVLYNSVANVNEANAAFVTFTCTRAPGDAATLAYRIKATLGSNSTGGTNRRARLGTTGNYITYSLRRGATCNNASNWADPATGTTNVQTGNLTFAGTNLTQSVNIAICTRVPAVALPAAGVYTDTFGVRAQHSTTSGVATSDASPHTPYTNVTFSVGVSNQCVFNSVPRSMVFNYTSFSNVAVTQNQSFDLRCSNTLPWTVAVSPASSVVVGLTYNLTARLGTNPAAATITGTGTGNDQVITLTGTIPAGQAGTCSGASCTGSQVHTVTITY